MKDDRVVKELRLINDKLRGILYVLAILAAVVVWELAR